jgi:serralysin
MNASCRPLRPRVGLVVEELEPRLPPASAQPTALEQEFLERLNDARGNPPAYGRSIGLNLAHVKAAPPLAFDRRLMAAARGHSLDMAAMNYFNHVTPNGVNPFKRIRAAGFVAVAAAESIEYASLPTFVPQDPNDPFSPLVHSELEPDEALAALIVDFGVPNLGHRKHLLAIDPGLKTQNLVGIGYAFRDFSNYSYSYTNAYWTIDSGFTGNPQRFLTGAVFRDQNGNGKYDAGEGVNGVTIRVAGAGKVSAWDSGGYTVALGHAGTYRVTASGGGLAAPVTRTVHVGKVNARLEFIVP